MMGRWDVRVVKEIDSKSIGLVPRRFESCSQRGIFPELDRVRSRSVLTSTAAPG